MQDPSGKNSFSLANLRGTPLAVLLIIVAAALLLGILGVSFKGSIVV